MTDRSLRTNVVRAGLACFALVFAAGFVSGTIRRQPEFPCLET